MFLLDRLLKTKSGRIIVAHVNYGMRGDESIADQKLVERIAKKHGLKAEIVCVSRTGHGKRKVPISRRLPPGFEDDARAVRYAWLRKVRSGNGGGKIALAHHADDQVETVLMRILEGAGIAGLKGIPRDSEDGIVRPILAVWEEDILKYLKKQKIPYRIDRSNFDTNLERNWIRHVLIPLLVRRYGKAVKKRIFTLGERFREIDSYMEVEAGRWIRANAVISPARGKPSRSPERAGTQVVLLPRKPFSALPTVLRVKIVQRICFDRLGLAPNERLLAAMDRTISGGGPSARLALGKGWELANRYGDSRYVRSGRALPAPATLRVEEMDDVTVARAKRLAAKGDAELFDSACIALPVILRALKAGDRIRPFGLAARKKVKEILIDRKVPREERWGRPVVCDAAGELLWIPGIVRSAHAPVTRETRKAVCLRVRDSARRKADPENRSEK